jgi:hypothetical protein
MISKYFREVDNENTSQTKEIKIDRLRYYKKRSQFRLILFFTEDRLNYHLNRKGAISCALRDPYDTYDECFY